MYPLRRSLQGFLLLLLSGLLLLGTSPAAATSLSLPEAQEHGLVAAAGEQTAPATDVPGPFGRLKNRIIQTWNEGNLDLIATVYAWHNRYTYDDHKLRRYNENAWGGGLGLSMFDEDGDSHMLFVSAFNDSWKKVQTYGGYAFLKNHHFGPNNDFRIGAGVALAITQRHEYNYVPLPLPLPIFGIGYRSLSIEAAYVPGTRNNGNVLFTWVRWTFN